jgi:deoxyribodipyrimidine photo-lyase
MNGAALVWFRLDLRLADNGALERALAAHPSVIPVFIWAPEEEAPWAPGGASRWWLHQSLAALEASLAARGSRLIVRRGPSTETLRQLAAETGAGAIYWNRRYEPVILARDRSLKGTLGASGLVAESCPGNLLFEPWTIRNTEREPFHVFTPFWRACLRMPTPPQPKPASGHIPAPAQWPASLAISELGLEPKVGWAAGMRQAWQPGEAGAADHLNAFLAGAVGSYATGRDCPGVTGTSRLSPYLHFGEISARQVWHALHAGPYGPAADLFLRQIAWREFGYHLLFHFPNTPREPFRPEFRKFTGHFDAGKLKAWSRGRTGYPLVDAGMRELWHTGWMHNRVRMVVASFLVKHLMIPWQEGAAWFWDTLVDADLANNTLGWQWSAGCGADAAPYFRIFNPTLQGEKFDRDGDYVRRWVPELARLSSQWIQKPWKAPPPSLATARIELGKTYPLPIVEHRAARARALAAFAAMRQGGAL